MLQWTYLNIRHCVLGVMLLRIDSFVGSRVKVVQFKMPPCWGHSIEQRLLSTYKEPVAVLELWEYRVGFIKKPLHPHLQRFVGVGGKQWQIDRNASNPACSIHWEKQGPKEVAMKELLILTGIRAGLQRGGEMPKGVPPYSSQEPICETGYSRRNLF